jgi:hypothetical protein
MSITKLANLALALVPLGWLLALYGVMSQLGDPASTAPRFAIESHRHVSNTALLVGVTCLIASLWLSGRSFAVARKRSLLATALIAIPTVIIIADFY